MLYAYQSFKIKSMICIPQISSVQSRVVHKTIVFLSNFKISINIKTLKKLTFCHKLKFPNPNIYATLWYIQTFDISDLIYLIEYNS